MESEAIKKKAAWGLMWVGGKRIVVQVVVSVTNIVLIKILGDGAVGTLGMFAIMTFWVGNLGGLGNLGLGAAVVQSDTEPTDRQLRVVFSTVLAIILMFTGGVWLVGSDTVFGFWLKVFSLVGVVNCFGLVSAVLMERGMAFEKLATAELAGLVVTQTVVVTLVAMGQGIGGLVVGNMVGAVFSSSLLFFLRPWRVGFSFRMGEIKRLLKFGVDYELKNLAGLVNGGLVPVLAGKVSGPIGVGYLSWAAGLRQVGLAPLEVVEKVMFPTLARSSGDTKLAGKMIETMIRMTAVVCLPLLAAIGAMAGGIVRVVYTQVWAGGLASLYIYLVQGTVMVVGNVLMVALFALGKAGRARNIALMWSVGQWVVAIPLAWRWGFNGVAAAGLIAVVGFWMAYKEVRREIDVRIWTNFWPYVVAAGVSGLIMNGLTKLWRVESLVGLGVIFGVGMATYVGVVLWTRKEVFLADARKFLSLVKP